MLYITITITKIIFFGDISQKPNLHVLLTNADFEYKPDISNAESDFISYGVDNYWLSLKEKPLRLKAERLEKLNDDITLFISPVLIKFIDDDLCDFYSSKGIYDSKKSYLEIKKDANMKCASGNKAIAGEFFAYTDIANFYGNKGIDLYQDTTRIKGDSFKATDSDSIVDIIGNAAIYFYSDKNFTNITATILADTIHYVKKDQVVYLYDNVKIITANGIIEGRYGECYLINKDGKTDLNYMIISKQVKYSNNQGSDIFADEMRYYKSTAIVDMEGNVLMKNDSAVSKAPYFAYDINADIGRFITEYEYYMLKKQYPIFGAEVARYVIYSNRLNLQNKAVRVSETKFLEEKSEKNLSTKSKIRIKGMD